MPQKEKEQWKGARKVLTSHVCFKLWGRNPWKEWAKDGNREERLKLFSESQGTVKSDWWTHFTSETVASALDQVKHLLVQNGKIAPVSKVLNMIHPKISSLVSLTQLSSAFSDDFPEDRWLLITQQHAWCCGQTEVFLGPGSARGVCTCFRCYTWSTYRISISFHLQNTKSNPSECPELFLSTRLCCQSDSLHGIWAIFQRIWSDWEPGQTWKDVSDSLAKLLFCRKVIKSQSNKITSSSLHNELFQIKQNEVLLSARPWTVSSILQCFSVNCSVITSWLYHWLK